jgi:hypothetical protein
VNSKLTLTRRYGRRHHARRHLTFTGTSPPQELAGNVCVISGVCRGKFLGGGGEPIPGVRVRNDS